MKELDTCKLSMIFCVSPQIVIHASVSRMLEGHVPGTLICPAGDMYIVKRRPCGDYQFNKPRFAFAVQSHVTV